eukprot:2240143-Alexandrium_andersonii.AAC.1
MSASLVGSEMCIRDSHSSGAARKHLPCAQHSAGAASSATRLPPSRVCLLYTSDAADECSV